jgi:tetratricopeptide (TPR) repeat protein
MTTLERGSAASTNPAPADGSAPLLPLSAWLLRPYLDLSKNHYGPLHCQGLQYLFRTLTEPDLEAVALQVHPSHHLRRALVTQTGLPDYEVILPSQLPIALRTPRWQHLVELLEDFRALPPGLSSRTLALLEGLGLLEAVVIYGAAAGDHIPHAERLVMAVRCAKAAYRLTPTPKRRDAMLASLQNAAEARRLQPSRRLGAALTLLVDHARGPHRNMDAARQWRAFAEALFNRMHPGEDVHGHILASTYWRAVSFVPFLQGDRQQTTRELDLAEHHARAVSPTTPDERLFCDQNWHPLLETRAKEAAWRGEHDMAVARLRALARLDPLDAKVMLKLGGVHEQAGEVQATLDAYRAAAKLGAPYGALAWMKLGLLQERQGAADQALAAYTAVLRTGQLWDQAAKRAAAAADRGGRPWPTMPRQSHNLASLPSRAPSAVLLRPYLDLHRGDGPIHAQVVSSLADLLGAAAVPTLPFQGNTSTRLRPSLLLESRLKAYDVIDPRQLPPELRSPGWQLMCDQIDGWASLPATGKLSLVRLLARLGLFTPVLALLDHPAGLRSCDGASLMELLMERDNARFKLQGAPVAAEAERNLVWIARNARCERLRLRAAVNLVVHHGKLTQNLTALRSWAQAVRNHLQDLSADHDAAGLILLSAGHRGVAFLPFLAGDRAGLTAALDRAEEAARAALTDPGDLRLHAKENLHALLETRAKSALWSGDDDKALAVAHELAALDPYDGKVHEQLGQVLERFQPDQALAAYRTAVLLGAPAAPGALLRSGALHERRGDHLQASLDYLEAARLEPQPIRPLIRLLRLARVVGDRALGTWAGEQLTRLQQQMVDQQGSSPPLPAGTRRPGTNSAAASTTPRNPW